MQSRLLIPILAAFAGGVLGCDQTVTNAPPVNRPSFITHGTLDGDAHPAVVLVLMEIGGAPALRCSGTLIAPTVVLTAGHCVGEPGEFSAIRIFTESDVDNGDNNYPFAGPNSVEATEWHAHPLYTDSEPELHDVGVVLLSQPVQLSAGQYGTLPGRDQLDALHPSRWTVFTTVGYGLQSNKPGHVEAARVRMFAEPHLVQINSRNTDDFLLALSDNARTGGACFGDSGGPNYLDSSNVIAAVTQGGNDTCTGTFDAFRLDRQNVLDFVHQYVP